MKLFIAALICFWVVSVFAQTKPQPVAPTPTQVTPSVSLTSKDKLKSLLISSFQLDSEFTATTKRFEEKRDAINKQIQQEQDTVLHDLKLSPTEYRLQLDQAGDIQVQKIPPPVEKPVDKSEKK